MSAKTRLRALESVMIGPLPPDARRYIDRAAAERGLDPDEVAREAVRVLAEVRECGAYTPEEVTATIAAQTGEDPTVLLAEAERSLARWDEWSAA